MIATEALIPYMLIAANIWISVAGFRKDSFFDGWKFEVDAILVHKEYYRLLTSAFLHGSILHLIFNMLVLYSFGPLTASIFGPWNFLGLYVLCMLLAGLFALYIHRNHSDYSMIGASGAISGIMFAMIVFAPDMRMGIFMLPLAMPAWLFGLIFILGSIYGIKSQMGNIGHEAHLGGAIAGIILAVCLQPEILQENPGTVALLLLPVSLFLVLILKWPEYLLIDRFFRYHTTTSVERYQKRQNIENSEEINRLLDKVAEKGMEGLSWHERRRLTRLSKKS